MFIYTNALLTSAHRLLTWLEMGIFSLWADSGVVVMGEVVGEGDAAMGWS